ncbi:MAG: energy transducer TonB [Pseudomonadota bacterium]
MRDIDLSAPPRVRVGAFVVVALLHLLAVAALVRAFAPGLAGKAVDTLVTTFAVTAPTPTPSPTPLSRPSAAADAAGAAGRAGQRAVAREVMAPRPKVDLPRVSIAPPVASTGAADRSGAVSAGSGTGAGRSGEGTGSGGAGLGQGGPGGASKPVKIAGDINSARDYPVATRDLRIGDHVVVWITVGIDGRPTACRVARASRDAEADSITCRLAMARFRFTPAVGTDGRPQVGTFGWQQRWYYRN